jgi:hypothetical protein
MELMVVLAILAALAGVVIFRLTPGEIRMAGGGRNRTPSEIATRTTLENIRQQVLGTPSSPGYYADMGRDPLFWPVYLDWLLRVPAASEVIAGSSNYVTRMQNYNPATQVGWRGPYIQVQGYSFAADPARGFTTKYGFGGHGWGNPIVMQLPTADYTQPPLTAIRNEARLVSAGPNGNLDSELNNLGGYAAYLSNPALAGDDVILWFFY